MSIPIILMLCIIAGAMVRLVWGWLDNGEPFQWRKMVANVIITIVACVAEAVPMMSADIVLNNAGLFIFALTAFMAGWAIDDAKKQATKVIDKIQKT